MDATKRGAELAALGTQIAFPSDSCGSVIRHKSDGAVSAVLERVLTQWGLRYLSSGNIRGETWVAGEGIAQQWRQWS